MLKIDTQAVDGGGAGSPVQMHFNQTQVVDGGTSEEIKDAALCVNYLNPIISAPLLEIVRRSTIVSRRFKSYDIQPEK